MTNLAALVGRRIVVSPPAQPDCPPGASDGLRRTLTAGYAAEKSCAANLDGALIVGWNDADVLVLGRDGRVYAVGVHTVVIAPIPTSAHGASQHSADDAGATRHTMDRGTAEMISRMLTDGLPPPAWVWDCYTGDGCDNRICRLAHLMRWAAAAKATVASCTPEHAHP